MRLHLVALALLLAACGTDSPTSTSAPPPNSTSPSSALPDLRPKVDAIGTLLTSCIARLQGKPVDQAGNCIGYMDDVAGVIGEIEPQADKLPEAARAALPEVRKALDEIAPCAPWFANGGGLLADGQLYVRCTQAWDHLYASYNAVRKGI